MDDEVQIVTLSEEELIKLQEEIDTINQLVRHRLVEKLLDKDRELFYSKHKAK